jgi:hypothetical protein
MSNETHESEIALDRIKDIEPKPTITIKLNDEIREKQRKLFRKHNDFIMRYRGNGTRAVQEGHIKSDKLEYAKDLVDLCVSNSSGLFEKHSIEALKKVFVRQPSFLDYVVDVITKVFDGDIDIEEDELKN